MNPITMLNPISAAITALYGIAEEINETMDKLIGEMKKSDKPVARATGNLLDGAKFGFGVGFMAPTVVITIGQLMLGNPLLATVAVVTTPFNPISMTCAAIGAIYFGWDALSEAERDAIVIRVAEAFTTGVELIKAVIAFVVGKFKDFIDSEEFAEMKAYVKEAASKFGKKLGEITRTVKDRMADAAEFVSEKASEAASAVGEAATTATDYVKDKVGKQV